MCNVWVNIHTLSQPRVGKGRGQEGLWLGGRGEEEGRRGYGEG